MQPRPSRAGGAACSCPGPAPPPRHNARALVGASAARGGRGWRRRRRVGSRQGGGQSTPPRPNQVAAARPSQPPLLRLAPAAIRVSSPHDAARGPIGSRRPPADAGGEGAPPSACLCAGQHGDGRLARRVRSGRDAVKETLSVGIPRQRLRREAAAAGAAHTARPPPPQAPQSPGADGVGPESLTTLPRRDHTHGVGDLLSTARILALSLWAAFLALVCLSLSLRLLGGVSGVYSLLPGDIVI
jgi:hypothetical protein